MGSKAVELVFCSVLKAILAFKTRITVACSLCLSVYFCLLLPAHAAHEIGFLIDTSGSMIKNDPQNLRQPAVRLAAQMLPQGSNAGIWLFDGNTTQLKSFAPVDQEFKDNARLASSKIHSRGQWTHIEDAVLTAAKAFSPDADSKSIILVTDGRVDISKNSGINEASRSRLLGEVLNSVNQANIQIHTIALSQNTDQDLLQRLAVGTNGMYAMAETADDLMSIFLQAFDQSIAADQVPLEGNTFTVDSSIREFTALIFRKPGSPISELQTPSGQVLSSKSPENSLWFTDKLYDLVTVASPETGDWTLIADLDPDNRVTIVSDLELGLRGLPNNIIQGQKVTLEFFLEDENGPINEPSLLSLLDIDFEQTIFQDPPKVLRAKVTSHNQGKVKTPPTGIFTARLSKTLLNGEHQFTVMVDGKTFKREQTKRARVFAQIFETNIATENTSSTTSQTPTLFVSLIPIKGLVEPQSLDITGSIKSPSGKITPVPVKQTNFGTWTVTVPPEEGKQIYKTFISVKGKSLTGDDFSITQGPIIVDYTKSIAEQIESTQDLFDTLSDEGNIEEQQEIKQTLAPEREIEPKKEQQLQEEPVTSTQDTPNPVEETTDTELDTQTDEPEQLDDDAQDSVDENSGIDSEESSSSFLLYAAIGLINLLLFVGGFFFVRRWFRKKQALAIEEDNALLNEVNAAKATAEKKVQEKTPEPEPVVTNPVDDVLTAEAAKISDMLDSIDDSEDTN